VASVSQGNDETLSLTVSEAESTWQGGVIVTQLSLRGAGSQEVHVRALGGRVGDLVQVVGHALPPGVGDAVRIKLSSLGDGESLWLTPLHAE
jgi:hypothetical protein